MASDSSESDAKHFCLVDVNLQDLNDDTPVVRDIFIDCPLPDLFAEDPQVDRMPSVVSVTNDYVEDNGTLAVEQGLRSMTSTENQGFQPTVSKNLAALRYESSTPAQGIFSALATAVSTVATRVTNIGTSVTANVKTAVSGANCFRPAAMFDGVVPQRYIARYLYRRPTPVPSGTRTFLTREILLPKVRPSTMPVVSSSMEDKSEGASVSPHSDEPHLQGGYGIPDHGFQDRSYYPLVAPTAVPYVPLTPYGDLLRRSSFGNLPVTRPSDPCMLRLHAPEHLYNPSRPLDWQYVSQSHGPSVAPGHLLPSAPVLGQHNSYQGTPRSPVTTVPVADVPTAISAPVARTPHPDMISSVSSQQVTSRKDKKVATYDRKSSWKDYHVQFEMVASLNGWDEDTKALELATSLRESAQGILTDLEPEKRFDYHSLVSALSARFESDNQADVYLAHLRTRVRAKSESLPELGQEIKKLARHALPSAPSEVREWLALTHFVDALDNEFMEYSVKQAKPRTVDDAVKAAVEIESFQLSRRARKASQGNIHIQCVEPFVDNASRIAEVTLDVMTPAAVDSSSLDAIVQNSTPMALSNECQGCGTQGHMARDCTAKCERCLRTGHVLSHCRTKQCTYCGRLYHNEGECRKKFRDSTVGNVLFAQ